jgi:hypothetical protein
MMLDKPIHLSSYPLVLDRINTDDQDTERAFAKSE